MKNIQKVLIANRGEIAIRIARTCRRLGLRTVGICSELDRKSLHVDFCDEVYSLGEGSLADTYLNIPKIIEIAKKSRVHAVHPGYGFLSERAKFAQAVIDAGMRFVGPRPETIQSMGDKLEAKAAMKAMGVPLLPGSDGPVRDFAEAREVAARIGYPVLLKAAAGGGGKGIRIVRKSEELKNALESAAREATTYFGDGTVYIEKFLENPHHIEVQVMGDGFGGGGHVFDRECSIQRRHQKLLEESPAPLLNRHPKSKARILDLSNQVVEQMKYANAGTLEFLGDDDGNFYFLEMNTRLQVEHPVTEWVAGVELVEWQLRVADGERLTSLVSDGQRGHSIEVRIYAETPFEHLPTGGTVLALQNPAGPFIRVDSAIYSGYKVPLDYDPTLMKLSVWGSDRPRAVARLREALDELRILGVNNNQGLFWAIAREKDFIEGIYGTPYLEKHKHELKTMYEKAMAEMMPILSMGAVHGLRRPELEAAGIVVGAGPDGPALSGWGACGQTLITSGVLMKYTILNPENEQVLATVDYSHGPGGAGSYWEVQVGNQTVKWTGTAVSIDGGKLEVVLPDGVRHRYPVTWSRNDGSVIVATPLGSMRLLAKRGTPAGSGLGGPGGNALKSSMPGKILRLLCKKGDRVEADQPLLVMEAMKMENEIRAPKACTIEEVTVIEGQKVETGALLVRFAQDS